MLPRPGLLPKILVAIGVLALVLTVAGCGGGSGSSSTSGETNAAFTASSESGASAEFLNKGDRSIVEFGKEASEEDREAAGAVLTRNLRARQAANFAAQCATLTLKLMKQIPEAGKLGGPRKACPGVLRKVAMPLSATAEIRKDTLSGPIAALRVKGNLAQALYHGNDGKDYAIALEKEDGTWKVGALVTTEL
jgi:hypothetical protein